MLLQYIISLLFLSVHCFDDECYEACMRDSHGKLMTECSESEGEVCWICQTYICSPILPTDSEMDRSQDSDVVECQRLDKNLEIFGCSFDSMKYLTCDVRCKESYVPLTQYDNGNSLTEEIQEDELNFKITCSVQSGLSGDDDARICVPRLSRSDVLSSQKRSLSSITCSKACMRDRQGAYINTECKRSWAAAAECFLCRQRWCNSGKILVGR